MNVYEIKKISEYLKADSYLGRGIAVGTSECGKYAVCAYFISGRSENSRNRVFAKRENALFTEPFDEKKVKDPSLIIYAASREIKGGLIVTNGDQTDTVYRGLSSGKSFSEALDERRFEPDAPNFTPRISALLEYAGGAFSYEMSILKSVDEKGSDCARYTFSYPSVPGLGHFIHTYEGNGDPLPSFTGEPRRIKIPENTEDFASEIWNALDEDNKISLFVRYTDIKTGEKNEKIINKNGVKE
ncbi:MAG: IMP cyclohydrolase [Clostridia bacterium]|nr:IMP cyclohydrolase [Clostridia bacterium]